MELSRRSFIAAGAAGLASAAGQETFVRVSRRDPRYLELSDGSPYIPIGLNLIAPPQRQGDVSESLRVYAGWLDKLRANGGNYVRVWLSNPFWDVEHQRSGEYDESRAKLVDAMLAMVRDRGIRVKMTMEHFRSIGGGPQAWADKPLHHVSNGGPAESIADFFDGEPSRAQFRKKIEWYAQRYGNRPEIFGWELWNEINAVRGGDYLSWTEVMLQHLHRHFPQNLCMQSLGSFDTDRVRETYRRHSVMRGNDLAQVHRYLDLGAPLEICGGPMDVLSAAAIRDLFNYQPNRPVLLAEGGAVEPKHTGPFKLYAADRDGTLLHDVLFAPFFSGAAGPGQIWHWDAYVDRNDLWWHFGRFAEAVKGIDPAEERFTVSTLPHPRLRVFQLRGRKTTLLWCRDMRNDWRSELERGEAPETLTDVVIDVPELRGKSRARAFDPWTGEWTQASATPRGQVRMPRFRRSIVLRSV